MNFAVASTLGTLVVTAAEGRTRNPFCLLGALSSWLHSSYVTDDYFQYPTYLSDDRPRSSQGGTLFASSDSRPHFAGSQSPSL